MSEVHELDLSARATHVESEAHQKQSGSVESVQLRHDENDLHCVVFVALNISYADAALTTLTPIYK
jgi:hypothetical protein